VPGRRRSNGASGAAWQVYDWRTGITAPVLPLCHDRAWASHPGLGLQHDMSSVPSDTAVVARPIKAGHDDEGKSIPLRTSFSCLLDQAVVARRRWSTPTAIGPTAMGDAIADRVTARVRQERPNTRPTGDPAPDQAREDNPTKRCRYRAGRRKPAGPHNAQPARSR
jgi:hypothetical protein